MTIKTVNFHSRFAAGPGETDCIVLRTREANPSHIEVAFPFHEDTPNFILTIPEAMALRNALDQLSEIKFLGGLQNGQ